MLIDVQRYGGKLQIDSIATLPSKTSIKQPYLLAPDPANTEDEGGVELEFVISAKPNSNTISIPFFKENVTLYYQPPLTEEFKQENCEVWTPTYVKLKNGTEFIRPDNVVGSYAVYHSNKYNGIYKTGKICHIFRPKLIDAKGRTAWAEFNRDADKTGVLTITLPQDFLDSAQYPVIVDPTFGYTTIGGTSSGALANTVYATMATLSESGNITSISWYGRQSNAGNSKCLIYSNNSGNPNTLLVTSNETNVGTSNQWWVFSASGSLSADNYWLSFFASQFCYVYLDSATAYFKEKTATYPNAPNPFGTPSATYDYKMSIYATYTPSSTVQTVTDAVGLTDSMMQDKPFLPITQAISVSDSIFRNKTLAITDDVDFADAAKSNKSPLIVPDAVSIADLVSILTEAIIKTVVESVGLVDAGYVNKTAIINDALSVLEQVFRHKPAVSLSDAIGVAEAVLAAKLLTIADSAELADALSFLKALNVSDSLSLVDAASTPARALWALDAAGLSDNVVVDKVLLINDGVSIVEFAEVGVGGAKRTKLFLILGDLAVQLSSE